MILRFDTSLSNLVSMQMDKINKVLMFVVQEDKEGWTGWNGLGWCSLVTKETSNRKVLEKENLPYSPKSESIYGPG